MKNIAADYAEIIDSYNNTKHWTIKAAPNTMSVQDEENQAEKNFYEWTFAKARTMTEFPKGAHVNV